MKKLTVLFQGDSITDANRQREVATHLGEGYVAKVQHTRNQWNVLNRGISGNRTYDLINRWEADCLSLSPDILSIFIGINEVWHKHTWNVPFTLEEYESNYRKLIASAKAKNPKLKIMIIEPFVLPIGAYSPTWQSDLSAIITICQRLAHEVADYYVPLQSIFAEAALHHTYEALAPDGVHPSDLGHQLIADEVLKRLG